MVREIWTLVPVQTMMKTIMKTIKKKKKEEDDDDDKVTEEVKNSKQRDTDGDWSSSSDDDDDISPAKTLLPLKGAKHSPNKRKDSQKTTNRTLKSIVKAVPQKATMKVDIPKQVTTHNGVQNVVIEDSSDDEISFKTSPQTVRSSALPKSGSHSTPGPNKRKFNLLRNESKERKPIKRRHSEAGHFVQSCSRPSDLNIQLKSPKTTGIPL